jgi:hypothetical protein
MIELAVVAAMAHTLPLVFTGGAAMSGGCHPERSPTCGRALSVIHHAALSNTSNTKCARAPRSNTQG